METATMAHLWVYWVGREWGKWLTNRTFVVNFTRSSRSNLSIGLLSHLLNIELFVILITKIPISVMMPYIVQVSRTASARLSTDD